MTSNEHIDPSLYAEVVDVVTRYATGIDTRDWDLFRSAFADDAKVDYGAAMGSWDSGADFAGFMQRSHAPAGLSVHRMTNIVITGIEPLTARTYGDALLQHRDDPATVDHSAGYYDDVFVRTADGLKIAARTTTAVIFERLTGNMAPGRSDLPV